MTDSQRISAITRVCSSCGSKVLLGRSCPVCDERSARFLRAVGVALAVAVVLCVVAAVLSGCCSTWQCRTRKSLDVASAVVARAVPAMRVACDKVLVQVKAAGCKHREEAACDPLRKCHDAETAVAKAALASQALLRSGLAAVDVADEPSALNALVRAREAWEALRPALKAYGVEVP